MRVRRRGAAALVAAFDLVCSMRPLPLCGGVTGMGYGSAAEPQALFLKLKELAEWNVQGLGDVDEQVYAASRGRVLHALNVVAG